MKAFISFVSCILITIFSDVVSAQTKIDFSRDIQPILSENCYFCHGPDPENREAGLRLDIESDALELYEPGDSENSELFIRVSSTDDDELMPPADSHRKLTPQEIGLIKQWIDEGATWGKHWAFVPIQRDPKASQNAAVDYYIQRRLLEHSIDFSPVADKRTLIRRVSIDLTGLPPSPAQIQVFLDDPAQDAYAKMVDRFLASPAYGERMAWNWLDAARYADTNGYQGDNERTMWPWRDWVINAYNTNMPFDQFSTWQLAGDLLPNATEEQILATGFNRNHPINGEGGRIPEENRVDYVMDMAETTGTVWMGLTFNCCRCHDHKYDQLSQKDYYSLFAYFNQTPITGEGGSPNTKPVLAVKTKEQLAQQEKLQTKITKIKTQLSNFEQKVIPTQDTWVEQQRRQLKLNGVWETLPPKSITSTASILNQQPDGSILATGNGPDNDNYEIIGNASGKLITAIRLEALQHSSMTAGGLSKSNSSNFVLTDVSVSVVGPNAASRSVEIVSAVSDYSQQGFPAEAAIDSDPKSGWAVLFSGKGQHPEREAIFQFSAPVSIGDDENLRIVLKHESQYKKHNIGRFRIATTSYKHPTWLAKQSGWSAALEATTQNRTPEQNDLIRQTLLDSNQDYRASQRELILQQKVLAELQNSFPTVMVMGESPQRRKSFVLSRGSYEQPQDQVRARVPVMFAPDTSSKTENRLSLAKWLFDDSNPLTSRVAVNRLWAQVFGTGLVKTTEDFGVQGEPPTHPELLDWLAAEYRDSGWNTKHILRIILNSRTYRQSSKVRNELIELDPENRLLARSPRYRMPSWMLRDYALAASGRLVKSIGGQPVNSYQPAGVWEESSFGKKKYQRGAGDEIYRRSIYTFWRRIAAPTIFFDNADRMTCSVKAYRTNTPLHALTTLNDTTFVESSRLLATHVLESNIGAEDAVSKRIAMIYERILARPPKKRELRVLTAALSRTQKQFSTDRQAASDFVNVGDTPVPDHLDVVELASWSSLCLAVINLDESLSRK